MAVKIRLARRGRKKVPVYKIVVANSSSPRDGKFLEVVGTYSPLLNHDSQNRVLLKMDRIKYWTSVGAQLTERVEKLISQKEGVSATI